MSNRTIRINELLQREISDILRKHYQSEAVAITISEVRVSPDLRDGRVFISVVGNADDAAAKLRWLKQKAVAIREEVARRVTLKYLPKFEYVLDKSTARGTRILQMLDELEKPAATPDETEESNDGRLPPAPTSR